MPEIKPFRARRAALLERLGAGVALVPTAPERARNRDSALSLPLRQLFLLPDRIPRARSGRSARRRAQPRKTILFCREKNAGARDLGRLPLRPGGGARGLRLRRGVPDRKSRREAAAAPREPGRAPLRAGHGPGMGRAHHALAERGARARSHRRRRAGGDPRRARAARRDAAREGRARARADAPRGRHLCRGTRARDARDPAGSPANTRSRPSSSTSSGATARSFRHTGRSSPAGRTPACCTIGRTTAARRRRRCS